MPSLRANGSGERPPDDRLRESNPSCGNKEEWIASVAPLLAMTGEAQKSPGRSPGLFLETGPRRSAGRLGLAAAGSEDVFGIAGRLSAALDDEIADRLA